MLLTEADVTGNRAATTDSRTLGSKRRRNAVDLVTLQPGDYVVHAQHGIGRFVEMRERTVSGATREYLVLEYASSKRGQPPDRLFVPTDALDEVSRYVGGEVPTLNKLGGADWAKTKGRARKAVREIAAQLVQLYAARQSAPGHAFAPDTPWQRELEDAFPFTETPDQLSAIDEVKADMERPVPMDRVVSGDVGFGKTEIAVRAAFKAVQDGKQVAVLVPTTLLATQHLQTFSDRMRAFPVNVKGLSRFTDNAEAKQTIAGLADGTVDVVVGTHRLLQTGVRWKDLGLVIVDEEQRFGVEHKEHITAMRTHVDVLTLSATPIPRTLEMSLAGIREMSTITTPPEDRHPTLTYVGAYADKQVAAAIRRELLRDGQVFYVHNRVSTIERAARHVRELVPEARVAVAHGQMNEDTLERTVNGFWHNESDVLVCTTIVENGLDISNANTLIVERSDTLGLSQLHQLRGRVGRGRERGYAYFLFPPEHPLTETAHDRLATIAQHSDLGSGAAVAMKDLEIRGAGNILGAEQSGHIAGVGFDLYIRLVGEAVAAFRLAAGAPGRATRTSLGRGAGGPAGRRARAARLRAGRAAAAGGLPQDRRGGRPGGARRDRRGAHRPLRRAAGRGAQPARRRRVPAAVPGAGCRGGRARGRQRPDQPGGAARLRAAAAAPPAPQGAVQGGGEAGHGAAAGRRWTDRRVAAARRGAARLVRRADRRRAGTGRRREVTRAKGGSSTNPMSDAAAAPHRLPWSGAAAKSDKGAEPDAPVTRALRRFGRRYPAVGRAAVSVLCALASPFAMPPRGVGLAVAAAAAVVVWNLALPVDAAARRALLAPVPGRHSPSTSCWSARCAWRKPVLVDPAQQAASLGWISPIASFTVVAIQFQVGVPAAAAATLAVCAAFVAGTAASPGLTVWDGVFAGGGGWMLVEAVLARLLWVLLQRAGREADRLMQAQFAAERVAATAAARRAAQRAHWATVHDTSASTLLMIGLGAVAGTEEWLPGQVRRDIGLLDGARDGPPDADAAEVALEPALADVACAARVRVEVGCPAEVAAPPAVVRAVAGAVAEALENVARHAGVGCARVDVQQGGSPGSSRSSSPTTARGSVPTGSRPHRFGLALSVHDRMASAGGLRGGRVGAGARHGGAAAVARMTPAANDLEPA